MIKAELPSGDPLAYFGLFDDTKQGLSRSRGPPGNVEVADDGTPME
eukprot:COSAG02_NODE_30237_length_555_cov_0.614035_1_plen_45_part_10